MKLFRICLVVLTIAAQACSRREPPPHPAQFQKLNDSMFQRPAFYTSGRIDGTVVDATTGRPLPGAAVVAVWRKIDFVTESWNGVHVVVETETDAAGRFTVARWGPRPVNADDYLDIRDPEIWILENGYLLGYFDNSGAFDPRAFQSSSALPAGKLPPNKTLAKKRMIFARPADATSIWDGRTLSLTPSTNSAQIARSLASAGVVEPYEAQRIRLPRFTAQWVASWKELPADLRERACCPRVVTDSLTPAERASIGLPDHQRLPKP